MAVATVAVGKRVPLTEAAASTAAAMAAAAVVAAVASTGAGS